MLNSIKFLPLSYRAIRALQICIVLTFTVFIQELLRFPHAGWTGFSVMMIYVGFDHGTTIFRAYHRFWGMVLGLISGFILWFLGHIDYRILIVVIPITIFFAYFLVGKAYSVPTVFTVNTAVIGTGYFAANIDTTINSFIYDYTAATILAFVICIFFEYFFFRRYGLMNRFINDTQNKIIISLQRLLLLLDSDDINRVEWFHACLDLNDNIVEINGLVNNLEFAYISKNVIGNEFNHFTLLVNQIFLSLKALYFACDNKDINKSDYQQILTQVQCSLTELEQLLKIDNLKITFGVTLNETK